MIKNFNWYIVICFWIFFIFYLFIQKPYFYRFDFDSQKTVEKYLKSQDIYDPQGDIKDRTYISDSEIYLASGYLYSVGENPSKYNFQHPPLLKYLYGFSLRIFSNPYVLQIIFSFFIFALTYFLGLKIGKDIKVSILALIFLIIDPLTTDSVLNIYLDLGQTFFELAFIMSFIYYPASWLVQGILLGSLLSTKFWSLSLFIFLLLILYRKFILKNFEIKKFIKTILISVLVYISIYTVFFLQKGKITDFLWLQLKMLKFMLDHNSVSQLGGQLQLFLTGLYNSWWSSNTVLRTNIFTIIWPLSLAVLIIGFCWKNLRSKLALLGVIVLGYFIATISGAPFTRYIIFVTPYLYIGLSLVIIFLFEKIVNYCRVLQHINNKNKDVETHFDLIAKDYDYFKNKSSFYYSNLKKLLRTLIPEGKKVLEIGCGTGDLLVSLKSKLGYGMDISSEMIKIAQLKHKSEDNITFSTKMPKTKFDYIFMSDVIEHLEDPEKNFKEILNLMTPQTKFILTMANPIWEPLLMIWEKMDWKMKEGPHRRITNYQLSIFIEKSGMKIVKHDYKLLIPIQIPFITNFVNKYLEKYFKRLSFIEYFIAEREH